MVLCDCQILALLLHATRTSLAERVYSISVRVHYTGGWTDNLDPEIGSSIEPQFLNRSAVVMTLVISNYHTGTTSFLR